MTANLLSRLQGLTAPDREVDADMYIAFNIPMGRVGRIDRLGGCVGWWPKDAPYESAVDVPAYTASLDAITALVERVLPGWSGLVDFGGTSECSATLVGPLKEIGEDFDGYPVDLHDSTDGAGPNPAIALCTALLRALEARDAS